MTAVWRENLRSLARAPMFWIIGFAAILRLVAITWGLPASDGWDDDGIAPRNIVSGLILTYQPGSYYIYPPLHYLLLTILTLPVTLVSLINAHSLHQQDVIASFIQPQYMTVDALVARLVNSAMSLGTILCVARITELIAGKRAGLFAAAALALEATGVYYAHVTNLDAAYLFWTSLSLLFWTRLVIEHEPKHLRWGIMFAAAAIATKDQAYATFLLSAPALLAVWFLADSWPRRHAAKVIRPLALWTLIALFALLLADGAITNPVGFLKRLEFLTGPASRDYAFYAESWRGRLALLTDMAGHFPHSYPVAAASLGLIGLALHVFNRHMDPARWAAGLLPLFAILSFTLAFNFVALRSEERFVLPQWVFSAVYIGIAADFLVFSDLRAVRYAAGCLLLPLAFYALFECAALDRAFLADPRYDAERWLRAHVHPGQTLEIQGQNCYLPRLPEGAVMTRVDTRPLVPRNPQIHVTEARQAYEDIEQRRPQFILIPKTWIMPFLLPEGDPGPGRIYSMRQERNFKNTSERDYFAALSAGRLHYRLAHESVYQPGFWPDVTIHESLGQSVEIFERNPG